MTATIIPFPVYRRLPTEAARLVDVAAERAERMGHTVDRAELAHVAQRYLAADADPYMRELLHKARAAIAKLPPRRR